MKTDAERLEELKKNITLLRTLDKKILKAKRECKKQEKKILGIMNNYDKESIKTLADEKIGKKPEMPTGFVILGGATLFMLPLTIKKCKEYSDQKAEYNQAYNQVKEKYYSEFEDQRNVQKQYVDSLVQDVHHPLEKLQKEYDEVLTAIENEDVISYDYKNLKSIKILLKYIYDGDANTAEEAINVRKFKNMMREADALAAIISFGECMSNAYNNYDSEDYDYDCDDEYDEY